MKNLLVLIFLLVQSSLLANAAQPGIWNAGGHVYTLLYPQDSASFKKVQMQSEQIFIQLYRGFAVVKGKYQFKNTTSESLKFHMGYPVNGNYSGGYDYLNQVSIDSLSQFEIAVNQVKKNLILSPIQENVKKINSLNNNWFVWEMEFQPNENQLVEVNFLVETNNAMITRGYSKSFDNVFIYLLETGSVWKNPIEKGNFYLQLMDGIDLGDLHGISDHFGFEYCEDFKILKGQKFIFRKQFSWMTFKL